MSLTQIHQEQWTAHPTGYRRWERRICLGTSDAFWERCTEALLHWEIKTRSGFSVVGNPRVVQGAKPQLRAIIGPWSIEEPIEVVDVLESYSRVGFAYATRSGHPVSGEEAFILFREGDEVFLEIRSLTAASDHRGFRAMFPLLLVAQFFTRRRYATALLKDV
ncbi:DUF1990 family protein [Glutamicibacter sp. JC586]|uniref:DUF1990 family protein n=1 Tax=Glutamicibacter sp. JC586 TaxID=2590552 RepID=UPI00135A4979|nr:DUF1990 family protein [Glutamicibacter sp. JC586]